MVLLQSKSLSDADSREGFAELAAIYTVSEKREAKLIALQTRKQEQLTRLLDSSASS